MAEWGKKGKGVTSMHTQGKEEEEDEVDEDEKMFPAGMGRGRWVRKKKTGRPRARSYDQLGRPAGRLAIYAPALVNRRCWLTERIWAGTRAVSGDFAVTSGAAAYPIGVCKYL